MEVTAFHVAKDVNNAWAISGIRMGNISDPFLQASLSPDNLPFIGHPNPMSDRDIIHDEMAFEQKREERILQYHRTQALQAERDVAM